MPDRQPITASQLWDLRRVGQPAPAADGSFLVVPVTHYTADDGKPRTALHRVPTAGGDSEQLTSAEANSAGPVLSPDGQHLAFVRTTEGDDHGQLAVMRLDGGEARVVTDLPLGITEARWLPDATAIVVLAPLLIDAADVDGTLSLLEGLDEQKVKAKVTEDRVYRFWDHWLVGGSVHHLLRVDLHDGAITELMPGSTAWFDLDDPAGEWDVSPDGAEVAFSVTVSTPPHDPLQWAVLVAPTDGSEAPHPVVADLPARQIRPRYSPDGAAILYGIQREYDFYADPIRLVRYDRETGTETFLTDDWDRSATGWEFTPDSATIVLAAEEHARLSLFTMPAAGGMPALLVKGGWAHGPRPAADGNVYFRIESLRAPAEVARVPLSGGEVERITGFNDTALEAIEMGAVEELEFAGAQGDPIQAFLVYPPSYEEGRAYPLVHLIHGGPHGAFGDQFHPRWNAQAFAAPGYVVALVNFHGSSGWGYDFATGIHGAWGDMPTTDVLAATDELVRRGVADPERMAITGGSYGGYLVSWLIGQTDRFAAAVCHAGVTNLIGQYGSDITQARARSMGANVWDDTDAVLRWSPTAHTENVTTPTLVIHGELDYRVLHTQGLELYGILKAKGVPSRLVFYPDENHWVLKRHNSEHWYGEVLGWLERYLG